MACPPIPAFASAGRFLGLGKHSEKEARERQCIREAEGGAQSAADLLTLRQSASLSELHDADSSFATTPSTERVRRHRAPFSTSTPPSSLHSCHHTATTTRCTSRVRRVFLVLAGRSATRRSSHRLRHRVQPCASHHVDISQTGFGGGSGGAKTSLLDKAMRYLFDDGAAPDRRAEPIWLMGVRVGDQTRPASHLWLISLADTTITTSRRNTDTDSATRDTAAFPQSSHHRQSRLAAGRGLDARREAVARRVPRGFLCAGVVHVPRDLPGLSVLPPVGGTPA